MRRSAEITVPTSHHALFWQESTDLFHKPAPPALLPPLHLWCTQSGVWELYINSWDYLALIKIHKQAKCKFICSSQQNVSLISYVLVAGEELWMVAFRGKFIALQIIFPSRTTFSKWIILHLVFWCCYLEDNIGLYRIHKYPSSASSI